MNIHKIKIKAEMLSKLLSILSLFLSLNFVFINKSYAQNTSILTDEAPKPIGPYSQAIQNGNFIYLSGQIGINPKTNLLDSSSIENEAKQVMDNIGAILSKAGFKYNNIVKVTIYLTDLANFKKVNEIYGKYFQSNPPARATVGVSKLPLNAHVEISVDAIK